MGFVIIGLLIVGGLEVLSHLVKIKPDTVARGFVFICFTGLLAGILIPTGGYKPIELVETVKLQPLNDLASVENGAVCYVSTTDKNDYTYYTYVYVFTKEECLCLRKDLKNKLIF